MPSQGPTASSLGPAGFREPLDLPPHDSNGAVTAVTANLMHMFGLWEFPADPEAMKSEWISRSWQLDAELGRKAGEPMYGPPAFIYLLKQGFEVAGIGTWDERRFVEEGLAYLKEFYAEELNAGYAFMYTEDAVAAYQKVVRENVARFDAFGDRVLDEMRAPTAEDIKRLLADGYAVSLAVEKKWSTVMTVNLAYQARDTDISLYAPSIRYNIGVLNYRWDYFMSVWRPKEGIVGFRLAAK